MAPASATTHGLVNAVKQRLVPLNSFESILERLIERLPRSLVPFRLSPKSQIEVLDPAKGEYRSTGKSPCFDFALEDGNPSGGWFYVEGVLVRNNGSRQSRLIIELADQGGEERAWPLTTNLRGSIREVLHLPSGTTQLRLEPTSAPGFFTLGPLLVHRIGPVESYIRRLYRVWQMRRQIAREPAWSGGGVTWRVAVRLRDAYLATARLRARSARGNDYGACLARLAQHDALVVGECLRRITNASTRPTFSFAIIVREEVQWHLLRDAIEALQAQDYRHWELFILHDDDVGAPLDTICSPLHLNDGRIRHVQCKGYRTDSELLNHAFAQASGSHWACLGRGDVLHEHALLQLAAELVTHAGTDLLYTDEDVIGVSGLRESPSFKPDWNIDLLRSCNYVSSACIFRRDLVADLGAYSPGFEGAENYELLLRACSRNPKLKVRHLARPLCGRHHMGDGVQHADRRHESELRALREHLLEDAESVETSDVAGAYRVRYRIPERHPMVSLIVPTRDRLDILRPCIESIRGRTTYSNWELLVVDNQSVEPATLDYLALVQNDSRIRVIRHDYPFNFSALNNFAVRHAAGELLGLLNNDVEVISPDWLTEMVSHALRPDIGAVGAKLLYANGTVQHAGVVLGIGGVAGHVHRYLGSDDPGYCNRAVVVQNLSAVTGACMVVRKDVYEEVGGMDEVHLVIALNDVDFCLKIRERGYRNLFTPYAKLHHHESLSRGRDDTPEKRAILASETRFMRSRWGEELMRDPAYNINLTLDSEGFEF